MDKIFELIFLFCCRFTICALNRLGIGCRFFRRAWLSILWFSFSALCLLMAVALAALQAFSIPPYCLFGRLRVA